MATKIAPETSTSSVQLLPPTETPQGWNHTHARALSDDDIEHLLQAVTTSGRWDQDHEEFRISIAGAQEKTALLWHNDCWQQPLGATPTTHMFKLPLGLIGNMQAGMHTSVENEWLCAQILQAYGLPVANCSINQFGEQKALIVERFDRKLSSDASHWLRLPQEDMCQATGIPSNTKYEANGGPGIAEILSVLDGSSERLKDKVDFFKAQIIFWLLAATDDHAKNFSLAHGRGGSYKMTPLYDVLSTWPIIGKGSHHLPWERAKLAMSIRSKNKHYVIAKIQRRHFEAMAQAHGLGHVVDKLLAELTDKTETVIEQVSTLLPNAFPEALAQKIFAGMRSQMKRLQK